MIVEKGLTLSQVAERLADGGEYWFWTSGMTDGHAFHKARYPATEFDKLNDGAMSAITFRDRSWKSPKRVHPTLLLDELTGPVWFLERVTLRVAS